MPQTESPGRVKKRESVRVVLEHDVGNRFDQTVILIVRCLQAFQQPVGGLQPLLGGEAASHAAAKRSINCR